MKYFRVLLAITVSILLLSACIDENSDPKTIIQQNVFKARGQITNWFSNEPVKNAEVFVTDTLYSEIAYNGQWEMELPEGDWTLNIVCDNYLPETINVHVDSTNPEIILDTRLKPVISGPVFRLYKDFYDLHCVEFDGLAYITENITGTAIGASDTIRAYDITDWYDVKYTGIELCPEEGKNLGRLTRIGNELWSCNGGNWSENIRKFSLPDLQSLNHWYFESEYRTNNFIIEKDGYLVKVYTLDHEYNENHVDEPYLDVLKIKVKIFDSKDLTVVSEVNYDIDELSPVLLQTTFFVNDLNIKGEQVIISTKYCQSFLKHSLITLDASNALSPKFVSCKINN